MNRRERRNTEKRLGLHKHYKKETHKQKWERWESNQENGKRILEDNTRENEVRQQERAEEILTERIANRAEVIAKNKKIPLTDALIEANSEYDNLNT